MDDTVFFTSVATIITISKIMIKECLQRNPIDDVKNYNGGGRYLWGVGTLVPRLLLCDGNIPYP